MVEVLDLLAEDEVLEQRGAAFAGLEAAAVLDGAADVGREEGVGVVQRELVEEVGAVAVAPVHIGAGGGLGQRGGGGEETHGGVHAVGAEGRAATDSADVLSTAAGST